MFSQARPIIHFLDLTERARFNHVRQPRISSLLPIQPSLRPAERGFVENANPRSKNDTDSESSQSLTSSDMSDDTIHPPVRPSSPHYQVPDESEMEQFPDHFEDRESSSDSSKLKTHCVLHCCHPSCRKTVSIEGKNGIYHTCPSSCIMVSSSDFDPPSLLRLTITVARDKYEACQKEQEIIIHLPAAFAILHHLRKNKDLEIYQFLLASPHYSRDTILQPRYYKAAAKSAKWHVLGGLESSLETMLRFLPEQSRVISIRELEKLLMTLARWDCAAWMKEWVWNKTGVATMEKLYWETDMNKGARVLVERAEESVRDVVGALVWWDNEGRAQPASG
ncbi:hypothetical protein DE146DRAFT_777871 [Phaeosphaeria sp. MPI-PUGE-AT-0046c]|nr:hypothetical protein DE146DRAFT_777871 [Phaeosphaeria sp. MPI-PUGE-AT-0046c]